MKILECHTKPHDWAYQIRKVPPMEKWFVHFKDRGRVKNTLTYLSNDYGMKYVTKQWDRDYYVLIILEEWQ